MATREELLAEARRRGLSVPEVRPQETPMSSEEQIRAEAIRRGIIQPSLGERIQEDLEKRGRRAKVSFLEGFGGVGDPSKQTLAETGFQLTGEAIGTAGDILGELASTGYGALPEGIREAVEYVPSQVLGAIGSIPMGERTFGERLGRGAQITRGQYKQFAEEYPRAARNVEAAANIGAVLPYGGATTRAGRAIEGAADTFKKRIDDVVVKYENFDADQLKAMSSAAYDQADKLGGNIPAKTYDNIFAKIQAVGGELTPEGKEFRDIVKEDIGTEKVNRVLGAFANQQGKPVSLKGFNEIDQTITEVLQGDDVTDKFGGLNAAGMRIKDMQEEFRDKVMNLTSKDVRGSAEGFKALESARQLWSKQLKMRDLENAITRGMRTAQPVTGLKNAMNSILKNPKQRRRYTEKEIKAIERAADTGTATELLNLFGSRLPSAISVGAGDFARGVAMRAGAEVPRNLAMRSQLGRVQDVLNTVGDPRRFPSMQERMARSLRGGVRQGAMMAPRALGTLGTATRLRAPQATALGLATQGVEDEQ